MKLSIKDIIGSPDSKTLLSVVPEFTTVVLADGEEVTLSDKSPVEVTVTLSGKNAVRISGLVKFEFDASCNRCLEAVKTTVESELDVAFTVSDGAVVQDDEEPYAFVDGDEIDLDVILLEEILVNYPAKVLCRPDCKGLCPVCGKNRNITDCECDTTVLDPRMAQFLDFLK